MGKKPQEESLDKELEEINAKNEGGFVEKPEDEVKTEPEETTEESPEEEKKGDEDDKVEEKKEGEEKPEEKEEEGEDKKPEEEKKPPIDRPVRHIPMSKYHSEKDAWKKEKENYEKVINDLKKDGKEGEDKAMTDDEIAEKHGLDKDLIKDLRRGYGIKTEEPGKSQGETEKEQAEKDTLFFFNEWDAFLPNVEKAYPKATPSQLKEAKEEMQKIAETKEFHDKDLDYVLFKNEKVFKDIFSKAVANKGPESKEPGTGGPSVVTAKSFKPDKGGKYDFSSLKDVEPKQHAEILSAMDPEVYMQYVNSVEHDEEAEGMTVSRDGKQVKV